jgi:hypothetical protein
VTTNCGKCGQEIAWTTVSFGTEGDLTSVSMWMSGDLTQNLLTTRCGTPSGPSVPGATHFPASWLTAGPAENSSAP